MASWILSLLDFLDRFAGEVHTRHIACFLKLFGCKYATRCDLRLVSDPDLSLLPDPIILRRSALIRIVLVISTIVEPLIILRFVVSACSTLEQVRIVLQKDANVVVQLLLGHLVIVHHPHDRLEQLVSNRELILEQLVPRLQLFHSELVLLLNLGNL